MQLMTRHRLLFALLLAAAGCGGGLGGGAPDPNSYDSFTQQFAAAVCAQSVSCGVAPSVASCEASRPENILTVTTRAGVRAGTIRYDAAKASSCLGYMTRAYVAEPCSVTAFATVDKTGMDDCNAVLTGTIADGGTCMLSLECVSGYCQQADPLCYAGVQCCPGTCAPAGAPTPLGAVCSVASPGPNCEKGTECVAQAASTTQGTCQVPSTVVGTPCVSTAQCALPLYCAMEVSINSTTGTCQPPIASGAPCPRDVYLPCDDWREYCHPTTFVCTLPQPVGAACDDANPCIGYAQCLNGKCVAMAGLHAHCDSIGGVICLGSLQCSPITRTCEAPAVPASCI